MLKTYDEKEQILAFRATVMLYPTRAKNDKIRRSGKLEAARRPGPILARVKLLRPQPSSSIHTDSLPCLRRCLRRWGPALPFLNFWRRRQLHR